jgi:plastocyanin
MKTARRAAAIIAAMDLACAASAEAGEVVQIKITDLAFSPPQVTAKVGDTIEWVNGDFIDHTATAHVGDWDVMIPRGEAARLVLTKSGTFAYFCRIHPNMTGTIDVSGD